MRTLLDTKSFSPEAINPELDFDLAAMDEAAMLDFLSPSLTGDQVLESRNTEVADQLALVSEVDPHTGQTPVKVVPPVVVPVVIPMKGEEVPPSEEETTADGTPRIPRGPRIKHVCRRAAVALGTPATFPSHRELTLSALPAQEKKQILEEELPGESQCTSRIQLNYNVYDLQIFCSKNL